MDPRTEAAVREVAQAVRLSPGPGYSLALLAAWLVGVVMGVVVAKVEGGGNCMFIFSASPLPPAAPPPG